MVKAAKTPITNGAPKTDAKERMAAISMAMEQIQRQYGKGSIMKFGDAAAKMAVEVIPTGSLALDLALGVGGLPRGRIVEIYRNLPKGFIPNKSPTQDYPRSAIDIL